MLLTGKELNVASFETLQHASEDLYNNAVRQPSVYLPAVSAMKRILAALTNHQRVRDTDVAIAENGLHKMVRASDKQPSATSNVYYETLSTDYFKKLNRSKTKR